MRFAAWASIAVWAVFGATGLLLAIVGGVFTGVFGVAGEPAPVFAALRGVFAHAVAFGLAQLAISLVGIWVAVRAARGSRASLVASGVMHAIYAAVVIGVVASGG